MHESKVRTTHTGSLPRPAPLLRALTDRERGGPELDPEVVAAAVAECVARQVETGLDVVNDGEAGKISYVTYVRSRLTGFTGTVAVAGPSSLADEDFPEFAARRAARGPSSAVLPACNGPITYVGADAVAQDIAALRVALAEHPGRSGFLTSASPGVIAMFLPDEHHPDRTSYLAALGEAMKIEYDAIHAAGLLLQVDCPDLAASRSSFPPDDEGLAAFRRQAAENLAALDHALRDIPPDRIRMHVCWGNSEGPHHRDVPLADIIDILLTGRAGTLSFEGANPRHAHEWEVFADVALPDDKVLMPGVVDTTTNYVEHPRLVAQRIDRYAGVVGADRVVAATDCGLATFADNDGVDPRIAWAKLRSLTEGAALART